MIVLEMKAVVKPSQCSAIDEAIRTVQFIRNKALRLWMDAKREDKIDKYSLNKYCAVRGHSVQVCRYSKFYG